MNESVLVASATERARLAQQILAITMAKECRLPTRYVSTGQVLHNRLAVLFVKNGDCQTLHKSNGVSFKPLLRQDLERNMVDSSQRSLDQSYLTSLHPLLHEFVIQCHP